MLKPEMNDRVKAEILNATCNAELDLLSAIQLNSLDETYSDLSRKGREDEIRWRERYAALYSLCHTLGIAGFYNKWRESNPFDGSEEDEE